jgi:lipoate-protein ligase A
LEDLEDALTGIAHEEKAIRTALSRLELDKYLSNITADDLIEAMF